MAPRSPTGNIAHLLKGIDFPRDRMGVVEYARRNNASPSAISVLETLPDQQYFSMADVFRGVRQGREADHPIVPAPVEVATPAQRARSPLADWVDQWWQVNPLHCLLPIEWGAITDALAELAERAAAQPERSVTTLTELNLKIMGDSAGIWGEWAERMLGETAHAPAPETDRRFDAPEWRENPCYRQILQTYRTLSAALLAEAERPDLSPVQRRRLGFHLRQLVDSTSPALFLPTNPAAQKRAMETGGVSLADGWRHLLTDVGAGRLSMTDTEAFAPGRNLALSPGKVVLRNRLIELIQYSPAGDTTHAVPVLFVPPWINKFYILDLQPKNSMVRFLLEQGFSVFMISWKNPHADMEDVGFEDYMTDGVLAASEAIRSITGQSQINPVGYCIGGTLLATTLAWLTAQDDHRFNAATFMVSLLDFSEVGETAVFFDEPHMAYMESQMLERGYLDSRHTANMFNLLRANDLIWSTVVNSYLLGKKPPAFDLLYWNADGTRMARAAHAFYLRNTYLENNLVKPGKVVLLGHPIDFGRIHCDLYAVGAEKDHIVPWQSAWRVVQLTPAHTRFVLAASGHIAGMINPPAQKKGNYWTNDHRAAHAEQWRATAQRHDGSWWNDWAAWLAERSGPQIPAPPMGPALADAPGTYV
ncbi:MAG: alpha/beta fold hydrolase [Rhodospirillaceae bacterium]|nr:alpha/beta fold hydrolase [Rhodospirillales bacterium]